MTLTKTILTIPLLFSIGCTHPLTVTNLDDYRVPVSFPSEQRPGLGIIRSHDYSIIMDETLNELSRFSKTITFSTVPLSSAKNVDFWLDISIRPTYSGSIWNLPINFPGFLVFMPAWHGYVYEVNYIADVTILQGGSLKLLDQFTVPFTFDVRHADFNRTWTEVGWLETGVIPLIGGFFFIQFDDNVADLVPEKTKDVVARKISRQIMDRISQF